MNIVLAIFSFSLFAGFVGILAFGVKETDLTIVILTALAMCAFDFVRSVRANEKHG